MIWHPPHELILDALAESLLEHLQGQNCSPKRVFIDGLEGFVMAAVYEKRLTLFFSALLTIKIVSVKNPARQLIN